jgi:hypothetical protein
LRNEGSLLLFFADGGFVGAWPTVLFLLFLAVPSVFFGFSLSVGYLGFGCWQLGNVRLFPFDCLACIGPSLLVGIPGFGNAGSFAL